MKTYLLIAVLFTSCLSYSQQDTIENKKSLYESYSEREIEVSMSALADHKLLTQFTGFPLNFVDIKVQLYCTDYLNYCQDENPEFKMEETNKYLKTKYSKCIRGDEPEYFIHFKYNLFLKGDNLLIKSCKISGYDKFVLNFYISYWPTKLNFEAAKKNELVINYLLQDRVALTWNPEKKYAEINITNTTVKF